MSETTTTAPVALNDRFEAEFAGLDFKSARDLVNSLLHFHDPGELTACHVLLHRAMQRTPFESVYGECLPHGDWCSLVFARVAP